MTAYVPPLYRGDMEARIRDVLPGVVRVVWATDSDAVADVTVGGASLPVTQRAALSRRVAGLRWATWPRWVLIDGGGPVLACGGAR